MGFLDDDLFGGMFDIDGDGKTSLPEEFLAFKMFEKCMDDDDDDDMWRIDCDEGLEYGIDPYDYATKEEYYEALEEAQEEETASASQVNSEGSSSFNSDIDREDNILRDYTWRLFCKDGSRYGIYPCDYDTEEEYDEALEEAKNNYDWRSDCEDGSDYGLDPLDYDTEEEYNEALEEAKNKFEWRSDCEDGSDYDIDPYDYDTEEEYNEALEEAKNNYDWRSDCEDGSDYDIDPYDYDTEEEYNEALEEAQEEFEWRNYCEDGSDYGLDPSDYDTEEEYNEALEEAMEEEKTTLAKRYLTQKGEFLFAKAIKDNFTLPITLPDEKDKRELDLKDILKKIARKDFDLSLKVWAWCVDEFLDYEQLDSEAKAMLTDRMISASFYSMPDGFFEKLVEYMSENPHFRSRVIREEKELSTYILSHLITDAIEMNLFDTAIAMFEDGLANANGQWKLINELTDNLIHVSKNGEELETIEFIEENMLPVLKEYDDGMILDEIEPWEQEIAEYKQKVEKNSDKYAYSRGNAWRKNVPNGEEYDLDPRWYDSEEEYLEDYNEKKYRWRTWYTHTDNYGLNPEDYETEEEFEKQRKVKMNEKEKEEHKRWEKQVKQKREEEKKQLDEMLEDKNIYIYCGVILPFSDTPYHFRTDDESIQIGDEVIVPLGVEEREWKGTVVSVGRYSRVGVPFPVEKTKTIVRKVTE